MSLFISTARTFPKNHLLCKRDKRYSKRTFYFGILNNLEMFLNVLLTVLNCLEFKELNQLILWNKTKKKTSKVSPSRYCTLNIKTDPEAYILHK